MGLILHPILLLLLYNLQAGIQSEAVSSTSPPPKSSLSATATPDQLDSDWIKAAIKDIAYNLRAHKFNEYDRRYIKANSKAKPKPSFYQQFAKPALRSLHWEVHSHCEQSFLICISYLVKRIRQADLRRSDDTAVVIHEQQWDLHNNSQPIEIVDKECRKMVALDDTQANPFEGPIERFQWRTSAMYYMCWYTMNSEQFLARLPDKCDNFANCLHPKLGPNNGDIRASDDNPYGCALYSFCPDPCCPMRHLTRSENCWNKRDNPCFQDNPVGQRQCGLNRSMNIEFRDLVLNRWNVSCSCPQKGFEWNSLYGMCVDVDECAIGLHHCDLKLETCINLPGNFKCACKWGHSYDTKRRMCMASDALQRFILQYKKIENPTELNRTQSMIEKILRTVFREKSCGVIMQPFQPFLLCFIIITNF